MADSFNKKENQRRKAQKRKRNWPEKKPVK